MLKLKKQYKQSDGTLIEVEGTEDEIERFEKKQQKQKASNEQAEKKRTVLYGKDLEEIRRVIREEIAAVPPRIEYRFYPNYLNPPWWVQPYIVPMVQPLLPITQPTWTIGQNTNSVASGQITLTTNGPASVFNSTDAVAMLSSSNLGADGGQGTYIATNGGWGFDRSANFLMSPVGVGG